MDDPNLNSGQEPQQPVQPPAVAPASTTEPPSGKKKAMVGALVLFLVAGAVAGGFYLFKATGTDLLPPSLELNAKATQGFIKDQKTGFIATTEEDQKCFEAATTAAAGNAPTQLEKTATNQGMHYIYWDGAAASTFKDLGCNTNPTKAIQLFMAQWSASEDNFITSDHEYYKKTSDAGKVITRVVAADNLDSVPVKSSGGVILATIGSTEIHGYKDGNTFASNSYGICDDSKADGWHLFAAHTKSAKELFKDCEEGQIKAFHIQTNVSPAKFKEGSVSDTLNYSMVWAQKGATSAVKVPDKPKIEEDAAAKKAAADKAAAAAEKAAADKAAADAKLAAEKLATEAENATAADKVAAEKLAAEAKAKADKLAAEAEDATAKDKALADKKLADDKAAADKKIAEEKALADKAAADKKIAADKALADKKLADEKLAPKYKVSDIVLFKINMTDPTWKTHVAEITKVVSEGVYEANSWMDDKDYTVPADRIVMENKETVNVKTGQAVFLLKVEMPSYELKVYDAKITDASDLQNLEIEYTTEAGIIKEKGAMDSSTKQLIPYTVDDILIK